MYFFLEVRDNFREISFTSCPLVSRTSPATHVEVASRRRCGATQSRSMCETNCASKNRTIHTTGSVLKDIPLVSSCKQEEITLTLLSSVEFEDIEPLTSLVFNMSPTKDIQLLYELHLYGCIVKVNNTSCCSGCCTAKSRQQKNRLLLHFGS